MRVFFLILFLLPAVFGLSEYAYLFPDVPKSAVLLSCKPFETAVSLTSFASADRDFSESVVHGRAALEHLSLARTAAVHQSSPWFYAGSNLLTYFRLSHACYHDGQDALSESISSVKSAFLVFDQAEQDLRLLGKDLILDSPVAELDALKGSIETLDPRGSDLGSLFLESVNATESAVDSPVLLRHAVSKLVSSKGLLESLILSTRKLRKTRQDAQVALEELREQLSERQREASRLQERLTQERLYLVPERAFSLQKTQFADSSLSFRFPEKWDRANNLLEESYLVAKKAGTDLKNPARFGPAMASVRKSLLLVEESLSLFASAERETLGLEKALTLEVSSRYARATKEKKKRLDEPLPRALGPRVVELSDRLNDLSDPTPPDSLKKNLASMAGLLDASGVDVSAERADIANLDNPADFAEMDDTLREKFQKRIQPLRDLFEQLLPYSSVVSLPPMDFSVARFLSDPDAFTRLESLLEKAKNDAVKKAPDAVRLAVSRSFSLRFSYPPVFLDAPADVDYDLEFENPMGFGSESVLVGLPKELAGSNLVDGPPGIRLTERGLFFSSVDPGQKGVLVFRKTRTLAKKTSSQDVELYSDFKVSRRKKTVTFFSDVAADVLLEEPLPSAPVDVEATHEAWYDGNLRARVLASEGVNTFVVHYSLAQPVDFHVLSLNGSIRFLLKNRLPFPLESFKASRIETFSCTPKGSFITPLGGQAFQLDFDTPLQPFEEKSFTAMLSCADLPVLSGPGPVSAVPVALEQARRWSSDYPEALEWLRLAEEAQARNQPAALSDALKKLEEVEKRTSKSLEARADALCGRCSPAVREPVMQARSFLFVRNFREAEARLSQAEALSDLEKKQAESSLEQDAQAERKAEAASAPELEQFLKATAGGKTPVLSGLSDLFDSAKKRLEKIKSGKIPPEKMDGELRILSEERDKLAQGLREAENAAQKALESAALAQKQFGNATSLSQLTAAENDFQEGRFSQSQLSAERLVRNLQDAPVSKTTGLAASGFPDWALGALALVALCGLVYYFHSKKPPETVGEI